MGSRPPYHPSMTSGYIRAEFRAQTLEQLRKWCGEYGDVAATDAEWSAMTVWSMGNPSSLSNPAAVVSTAMSLCQTEDRVRLGFPNLTGIAVTNALPGLSPEVQHEARLVAAETMADWRRAGCPHLVKAIEAKQKYIHAYVRQQSPDKENIPA